MEPLRTQASQDDLSTVLSSRDAKLVLLALGSGAASAERAEGCSGVQKMRSLSSIKEKQEGRTGRWLQALEITKSSSGSVPSTACSCHGHHWHSTLCERTETSRKKKNLKLTHELARIPGSKHGRRRAITSRSQKDSVNKTTDDAGLNMIFLRYVITGP